MIKKVVLKLHQILGSLLSLVFVVWFISGFVMLFSGFPHVPRQSLFKKQEAISVADSILELSPETFIDVKALSLEKLNTRLVYRIKDLTDSVILVDAGTLGKISSFNPGELEALVQQKYNAGYKRIKIINDFDAWIPWSNFSKYFPIYKYYLQDSAHTVVYASSKTGEIVQVTNRKQRWLARFGAIPHWFYFKNLRLKKEIWINLIVWISGIGSLMCLAGIILGFYRWNKTQQSKRKGMFSISPYKKKWYKWHHITGFFFGIVTFTFVFSGMMSLQRVPKFIVPVKNEQQYLELWNKKRFELKDFQLSVNTLIKSGQIPSIRRIDWCFNSSSSPFYKIYTSDLDAPIKVPAGQNNLIQQKKSFTLAQIEREFQDRIKEVEASFETLYASDGYYFENNRPVFPIIKAICKDNNKTWLYINPRDLKIVYTLNKNTRLRRWLYKGLHCFDFKALKNHNWLRISLLFVLSIFGAIISISGLKLSINYIGRKVKKYKR